MSNWLTSIGRLFSQERRQTSWLWQDRQYGYLTWDAYYANTIYETLANGGQRENINAALGNASAADLAGLYNPVAAVVDLYLHVFGGSFGDEVQVEPQGVAGAALVEAVGQLWKWSNLTIEKQPLCRLAATHGCVGIRIVARDDPRPERRRVYLKPEHPRIIRDAEADDRGNVSAIQLEYELTTGLAENATTITIREELTKESIRTYRVDGARLVPYDLVLRQDNGPASAYDNALGVVPYVLLRHEHTGDLWGRNSFYKARAPLDRLNALMAHIDIQIHRHVKVKWFIAAAGAPPTQVDLSDATVAYVNLQNSNGTPIVQPLVAPLDLGGALAQAQLQLGIIEDMLPELKATQGKFLAGQSGQTVAELRRPAEDRLALARSNYEDAMVRAQQIALSWGVLMGVWNLGTGTGSREAADAAYQGGYEDHRFNTRPLLPATASAPPAPQPNAQNMPSAAQGGPSGGTPSNSR